jgi:general secretion pathway protein K
MGVAVASHPGVKAGDPVLRQKIAPMETFEAIITSEEARLNLNALLSEDRKAVLERVFKSWGLDMANSEMLVDRLIDWTDPDPFPRLQGAEDTAYKDAGFQGRPFNRAFQTLDEPMLVMGMEMLNEVRPDWRNWFTLRGSGKLDVNEASAEMLAMVTGAAPHLAQSLVSRRDGSDGVPHTEDDARFTSVEEAATMLGVAGPGAEAITAMLTVESSTMRVVSIGRAGECARGISVVLRKNRGANPVVEWREFVVE